MSVATKKTAVNTAPAPTDLSSPAAWASEPLRELIASVPDYVLVLDRRLRVLLANRGVGRRSAKELEGLTVTEFFPRDLHPQALAAMHRVLATGQVDGYSAMLDDGDARHFDIRISPIRSQQQIVAITLIASETTEQVRAERAIATQARMIESMLEGVAVVSDEAIIEITNPAFDTMFGYRRGELIGRAMTTLAGWPFEQPERWRQLAGDRHGQGSMRVEFDGLRSDGSHFAAAGLLSRFDVAGRNHCLVVLQDVSERKQLERAILQAVNREQYRIGNDLHDGLGQELTGIALMLRGVAGRLAKRVRADPAGDRGHHAARQQRDRKHARAGARPVAGQPRARRSAGRAGRPGHACGRAVRRADRVDASGQDDPPARRRARESPLSHRSGSRTQCGSARPRADYTAALARCPR